MKISNMGSSDKKKRQAKLRDFRHIIKMTTFKTYTKTGTYSYYIAILAIASFYMRFKVDSGGD